MRPAVFNDGSSLKYSKSKPKARFSFYYVINKDSQIIAEAHTEHVFVDKNNKVINLPLFLTVLKITEIMMYLKTIDVIIVRIYNNFSTLDGVLSVLMHISD